METLEFLEAGLSLCLKSGPDRDGAHTACMRPLGHDGPCRFIPGNLFIRAGYVPREQFEQTLEAAAFFFGITEEPGE